MKDDSMKDIERSPFRGIHPYRFVDNPYFFGREDVVNSLFAKVLIYRLVLLFGDSGTGKSSVINAGLIPALIKAGFSPEEIRVRPLSEEPILVGRIHANTGETDNFLPSLFFDKDNLEEEVITYSLEKFLDMIIEKANDFSPVLIFDQFEELFTLFRQKEREVSGGGNVQENIFNTILNIVNNQSLKAKVLIIIREDFLGKLEILSKKYPQIFHHYVRLRHLKQSEAFRAIVGPFDEPNPFPSRIDTKLGRRIAQEIWEGDSESRSQLTQLQIVCSSLWDVYAEKETCIREDEFKAQGKVEGILERFMDTQLKRFHSYKQDIAISLLRNLITEEGTRDIVSQERLLRDIRTQSEKENWRWVAMSSSGRDPEKGRDPGKNLDAETNSVLQSLHDERLINRTLQKDAFYYEVSSEYLIPRIQKLADKRELEVLEQNLEEKITVSPSELRREMARRIRDDLAETLPKIADQDVTLNERYWFLVTVAEAFFGLSNYDQAGDWLQKAAALPDIPPWELESTARQLASLARIQLPADRSKVESGAWQALEKFLGGGRVQGVSTAFLGKVGLALSGGGFRASLFHIGVLAKLAELDMLRHVEVLSCVSGGSIIGAHYYLKVRDLFKRKGDVEIGREDYVLMVQEICREFLSGVQTNIRTRVAADLLTNLKMIFKSNFSRTMRAGDLYEENIYAGVHDGEETQPRWLNDLYIQPKDEDEQFAPKHDNWRRTAKVPILILNATSLNTGHSWQFTASWMGEPPSSIDTARGANYRLRRMYYDDAPPPYNQIRLGHAVAASACVPGLFEPLVLPNLYEGKTDADLERQPITVRLVDGGVHDNQGIMGLLDQDCNAVIVSDGSGQMDSDNNPSRNVQGVTQRSISILMARVREAEYRELDARRQSGELRNLAFIHLKKDLKVHPVDWIGCNDPSWFGMDRPPTGLKYETDYGILKEVQERLAAIRTDLDSFCDAEAYALMTSGYRMVDPEIRAQFSNFPISTEDPPKWEFLAVEGAMRDPSQSGHLLKLLKVGSQRAFKIWQLNIPLKITALVLGALALIFLLWACWKWSSVALITLGTIGTTVALVIAGAIFGKTVMRLVRYRDTLTDIAIGVGMSLVGWVLARIHLHVFDKWYLRVGKINP